MLRTFAMLAGVTACAAVLAPRLLEGMDKPAVSAARLTDDGDDASNTQSTVTLRASRNNHYFTEAVLNGLSVPFMVDTGASTIALSYEEGRRLGVIRPGDRWDVQMRTANGIARGKRVTLDSVRVGGIVVRNVSATVSEEGALSGNLLGMSFLSQLGRFEIRNGLLVMEQ
ncbi:membrane protein [Agaricicola taiwanensis]|uniref:Membrane protein n=1 Tax=Agaricicola taiwanensis TaxID=591372 RepID=A0A8J2VJP1_9RHOB|nr:TIGR02281 family clan AA aspartic protease [Agaricicola taiwanensis]GGE33101.1 membrane protein [Agaricicola taiwanensis]